MTSSDWRAQAGTGLIVLMSVLAACTMASYYSITRRDAGRSGDSVTDEDRFADIRALLPRRGAIGYLSERSMNPENVRAYYLAQYFLAPLVVAPDTDHDLVIANFASPSAIAALLSSGFIVERDFSRGLVLLRRGSK